MTLSAAISLFIIMLVLAAIPSASVALVVTRSARLGLKNGAAVSAGIVLGDIIFATLAILGMSVIAETLGTLFAFIKYTASIYLIWLGIQLLRRPSRTHNLAENSRPQTLLASFASGCLLTLGDVKAILFYASLFPAFVDMKHLSSTDIGIIIMVTIVTVGGVKLAYAIAARKLIARAQHHQRAQQLSSLASGGLLVGAGTYLMIKS